MSYTINFSINGTTGTFLPDREFSWTDRLNVINEANFIFSSSSVFNRTKVDIGAIVLITEGASIEFLGYVDDITTVDGGGLNVHVTGQEGWLGREYGAYSGSPWTATNNVTIFNAIIGESTHVTAGSSDSFGTLDFREASSDSLWNAAKNLSEKTSQDLNVVYSSSATTIGLVNTRQSASGSRDILNYGREIGDIAVGRSMPVGNRILVYGKGDGSNQIKSSYPSHGYDATSQATWGVITKIVEDYTISSVDEANLLADAEVARYKNPVKTYEFSMRVKRFKTDFIAGDTITLNSSDHGLNNEDVRITEIEKGYRNGAEFMNLTVTNPEFATLTKTRDKLLAKIQKTNQQSSTFMQGTTNILTFSDMINANNTLPLRVVGNLNSSDIYDEIGNRRINYFRLDYDVDPYRRGVGTATELDVAPDVAGSSSNTQPGVSGTSASTTPTSTAGVSVWNTYTVQSSIFGSTKALGYVEQNIDGSPSLYNSRYEVMMLNVTGGSVTVNGTIEPIGGSTMTEGNTSLGNNSVISYNNGNSNSTTSGYFKCYDGNFNCSAWSGTAELIYTHTHGSHNHADGSYTADNHLHSDGTYAAGSHNHSVSVGDGVSDSGAINATQVSIYIDWWNSGTSTWINKHSILNTGKTLDTDVDISKGNTLPDVPGFWRARIVTNNATPDLVQAIIKLKHQMDT